MFLPTLRRGLWIFQLHSLSAGITVLQPSTPKRIRTIRIWGSIEKGGQQYLLSLLPLMPFLEKCTPAAVFWKLKYCLEFEKEVRQAPLPVNHEDLFSSLWILEGRNTLHFSKETGSIFPLNLPKEKKPIIY